MLEASGKITNNVCNNNQGAIFFGQCTSLQFDKCFKYTIEAGETCNIMTEPGFIPRL